MAQVSQFRLCSSYWIAALQYSLTIDFREAILFNLAAYQAATLEGREIRRSTRIDLDHLEYRT